jgi:alkanesulfonate monooxygenase SsuD/methylene tetrahydromethanopterin reductase-like flavin-dependent oxidoreductase (luciferase family)
VPVSIGVSFPESVMPGTPLPDIAGLAGLAEQVGLDGVWVGDRLAAGELSVLDSGLSLAVAAAATSSIAVGYAIFVPSLRPLAWAARQVATLQHIAGGRLQLGVAVGGGDDAEYLAAGFRRSDRARRTDEFLARLPGLLAGPWYATWLTSAVGLTGVAAALAVLVLAGGHATIRRATV